MAQFDPLVAPELDALRGRPRNNPRPMPYDALDEAEDHGTGSTFSSKPDLYVDKPMPKAIPRDAGTNLVEDLNKSGGRVAEENGETDKDITGKVQDDLKKADGKTSK